MHTLCMKNGLEKAHDLLQLLNEMSENAQTCTTVMQGRTLLNDAIFRHRTSHVDHNSAASVFINVILILI